MPLLSIFPPLLLLLALMPAGPARAADVPAQFRFCSMDVDFAPFAKVDGSGHVQYLIVQAAKELGLPFNRHVAPRRRCLEEIKAGQADGMIAAFSAERAEMAVFPMADGQADESKALAIVQYFPYRRVGTQLDWNGQAFSGLGSGVIGVESGFALIIERLQRLNVRYDQSGKTLEQNLAKLAFSRVDGVVGMDIEADSLVAERFAGKIERIGKPFEQTALYLMVSKQFMAQYPKFMESYWQAIKEYRGTADYRLYQQKNP